MITDPTVSRSGSKGESITIVGKGGARNTIEDVIHCSFKTCLFYDGDQPVDGFRIVMNVTDMKKLMEQNQDDH